MKYLLDTHVLLWALLEDPRLSDAQADAIGAGELYLSAATVWEVGIKRTIGKLDVPDSIFETAVDAGCRPLPITWTHAERAAALPRHHNDPFDRMLVGQALTGGLVILSSDAAFAAYQVDLVR